MSANSLAAILIAVGLAVLIGVGLQVNREVPEISEPVASASAEAETPEAAVVVSQPETKVDAGMAEAPRVGENASVSVSEDPETSERFTIRAPELSQDAVRVAAMPEQISQAPRETEPVSEADLTAALDAARTAEGFRAARDMMLVAGWQPRRTAAKARQTEPTPLEAFFLDAGYDELEGCNGAICRFEYSHGAQRISAILTSGDAENPRVVDAFMMRLAE